MAAATLGALVVYGVSVGCVLVWLRRGDSPLPVERRSPPQRVALAGLLVALATVLQGAAAFWPFIGQMLATLSALPVAVQTLASPDDALPMALATAGVLLFIRVSLALSFLLTTAPLGLTAAWAATSRRPLGLRLLLPGLALSSGILLLAELFGVPIFARLAEARGPVFAVLAYAIFGLLYAPLWVVLLWWSGFIPMLRRAGPGVRRESSKEAQP